MKRSLRWKILLPFLALILLTGSTVAVISYMFSYKHSVSSSTDNMLETVKGVNNSYEIFFNNIEHDINMMADSKVISDYDGEDIAPLIEYFGEYQQEHPDIMNAYMGTEDDGKMLLYPVQDLPEDFDPRTRPWYGQAVEQAGEVIWTDAYLDAATNTVVISAGKAVENNGNLQGVLALDITTETLINIVKDVHFGETGYAAIIDSNGTFLAHPDETKLGIDASQTDYFSQMQELDTSGTVNYVLDGEEKTLSFYKNPTTGWYIVSAVNLAEFEKQASVILVSIGIALLITIVIALVISYIITQWLVRPIHELQGAMEKVEDGDLTVRADINRADEIGSLSNHFNQMINQIRTMMNEVGSVSSSITDASQTLAGSSEENLAASNEISTTMQQISSGTSNQRDIIDKNTDLIHHFSNQVENVQGRNNQMVDQAATMLSASENGMATVNLLYDQSSNVTKMIEEMTTAINSLDTRSNDISEIVTTITEIANQTNLLALNAAIEAARAGEHGKGFAVVASEVRSLAEQTEKSLEQITKLITKMQGESKDTVKLINQTSDMMGQQNDAVSNTEEAFITIKQAITETSNISKEVFEAMKVMIDDKDKIIENMENVNAISQETASGTEEITASVEEQNASMHELTRLAENLNDYAEALLENIRRFKI